MQDLNFVNDPVNPNYVIIVKLNAVDEAYSNFKKTMMFDVVNKQQYSKLLGEIIYLWEHLEPLVEDIKTKIEKKITNVDKIINLLNSDDAPTYQNIKQIIKFFHKVCYIGNITKPRSYVNIDYTKTNVVRGGKNSTFFE